MPAGRDLDDARLGDLLSRSGWGPGEVSVVDQTGSTNADLAAAARDGAEDLTVLIARHQTAGRGRFRRQWQSPPGSSVSISVLLHPTRPLESWPWLSLITGVALAEAFAQVGVAARVKWPNDVLADGGKLCGILAERVETPQGPAVVVGFGINLTMSRDELPVPTASSLLLEGADVEPTALVADVLGRWRVMAEQWMAGDDAALRERYLASSATVGREIRLLLDEAGGQVVQGLATGVDETGRIIVQTIDGPSAWAAGDVVHLR